VSNEERKPWGQMEREPSKWFSRFDKFRLMKPWARSINAVFLDEQKTREDGKRRKEAPGSWYSIAKLWQWNERAEAWDKHQRTERDRIIGLEEEEVLKSRYALKHNRIKDLIEMAELLREEVFDDDKRWVEDVKGVGIEPYYIKQFNEGVIREFRATLDDIAKEKGERVKTTKSELSGKVDGERIEKVLFYMPVVDDENNDETKGGDANANDSNSEISQD